MFYLLIHDVPRMSYGHVSCSLKNGDLFLASIHNIRNTEQEVVCCVYFHISSIDMWLCIYSALIALRHYQVYVCFLNDAWIFHKAITLTTTKLVNTWLAWNLCYCICTTQESVSTQDSVCHWAWWLFWFLYFSSQQGFPYFHKLSLLSTNITLPDPKKYDLYLVKYLQKLQGF